MENSVRDIYDAAPPLWDWRRGDPVAEIVCNEQEAAERDYQRHLERCGITAEEHEREIGELQQRVTELESRTPPERGWRG